MSLDMFTHRFAPATDAGRPPLLLLHGTGGDETDLLPLGRRVAPGSALLSPRGRVLENGMPRFFRRLAEGVFDEADLVRRTRELADFVVAARAAHGIAAPVALGFSNGANIAAALLLLRPGILAGAALLRPMTPLAAPPPADLSGTRILMLSGEMDPIVRAEDAEGLADHFRAGGAVVDHRLLPVGHGLTPLDIDGVTHWLDGARRPGRPAAA